MILSWESLSFKCRESLDIRFAWKIQVWYERHK